MNEMQSVTWRIKSIKQPHGGYLPVRNFEKIKKQDNHELNPAENVHGSIIGMVIDYLTRIQLGESKKRAFSISLIGAAKAERSLSMPCILEAKSYLNNITGIDDVSIINACKLVTFDVWKRNEIDALYSKRASEIMPDEHTIYNIKCLINRSVEFFKEYGPVEADGFTFLGGYTPTVAFGDGDFLTSDTLWEFKVIKSPPTSKHTLQLLMYWIMGLHSFDNDKFKKIKKLGIFNPRLNIIYIYELSKLSNDIIRAVEDDVICYKDYVNCSLFEINTKSILDLD